MNLVSISNSDLLIFVVGTSGSGKDSVMRETVTYLDTIDIPASILRRVITRPSDKNEESTFMTVEEFSLHKAEDEFALYWNIYDNWYGCGWRQIKEAINRKEFLLINISRGMLFKAREVFPKCLIILVTVPQEIAESRIKKRGREDEEGLQTRLTRMKKKIDMPTPNLVIENIGDLPKTAEVLGNFLNIRYKERKDE